MAIKNCGRHVYDSDQYPECPYCASGRKVMDFNTIGIFSASDQSKNISAAQNQSQIIRNYSEDNYRTVPVDKTMSINGKTDFDRSAGKKSFDIPETKPEVDNTVRSEYKTVPVNIPTMRTDSTVPKPKDEEPKKDAQNETQVSENISEQEPQKITAPVFIPPEPTSVTSGEGYLKADMRPADGIGGFTEQSPLDNNRLSVTNRSMALNENKTVGVFDKRMKRVPVVGWLVCVDGDLKGRDFRILAAMNTLGRSERMDICLQNDRTVSKENHARIAFDSKHNCCQLIPSEKSTNIYVNESPVYTPVKLANMDNVEIGESKFVFVSFCDDVFSWKED